MANGNDFKGGKGGSPWGSPPGGVPQGLPPLPLKSSTMTTYIMSLRRKTS